MKVWKEAQDVMVGDVIVTGQGVQWIVIGFDSEPGVGMLTLAVEQLHTKKGECWFMRKSEEVKTIGGRAPSSLSGRES